MDFRDTYRVRISLPDGDSTFFNFDQLDEGESDTGKGEFIFPTAGDYILPATILPSDPPEENPDRNDAELFVPVYGELEVNPTPFTPNGDGINDALYF